MVDTVSQAVRTGEVADSRSQVEELTVLVSEVLENGVVPDGIIVSRGPAPFTGLRVGLVTARVLGAAWDVPVLGVDELEVQAQFAADCEGRGSAADSGVRVPLWVVPVMDARRHEVYAALFKCDSGLTRVAQDWVGKLDGLRAGLSSWDADFPGLGAAQTVSVGVKALDLDTASVVARDFAKLALAAGTVAARTGAARPGTAGQTAVSRPALDFGVFRGKTSAQLEEMGLGTEPLYLRRPDVQEKSKH